MTHPKICNESMRQAIIKHLCLSYAEACICIYKCETGKDQDDIIWRGCKGFKELHEIAHEIHHFEKMSDKKQ